MKTAGVICEYNPFHNGHLRHLVETRRITGCDYIICVMSGAFTQRGEPAIIDKFARVRQALIMGADAVFELPSLFAVRTADKFALGGVHILQAMGADAISFGSETEIIDVSDETDEQSEIIRAALSQGKSHARAVGEATGREAPNAILGREYLRAMRALNSKMDVCVVKREVPHNGDELGEISSARAIRRAWREGRDAALAMPEECRSIFDAAPKSERFDDVCLLRLREADMKSILGAGEGLEDRVYNMARLAASREELIAAVKCKRYTRARIERLIACAAIGITDSQAAEYPLPRYARLLGYKKSARELVSRVADNAKITFAARARDIMNDPAFAIERRATDIWGLTTSDADLRRADRDCTQRLISL